MLRSGRLGDGWTIAGLACALLMQTAAAQPAPEKRETPAAAKAGASGYDSGAGPQISPEEQLAQGTLYLTKMRGTSVHVQGLADQARSNRDLIKLTCVNGKLVLVKGNLRLGEQVFENLQSAVAQRDTKARNYEFLKLTVAHNKVVVLGQEADVCVGEELAFVGETYVEVTEPAETRGIDPTTGEPSPYGGLVSAERGPLASPYQ